MELLVDQVPGFFSVFSALVEAIETKGAEAVIPPKRNRKQPRDFDKYLYKVRTLVERFINRIKQYRRPATHYEKTDATFWPSRMWHRS